MHHTPGQNAFFYLVVHSGYQTVNIGIYRDAKNLGARSLDKKTVSAWLMPSILELLKEHTLILQDLSFIAAHSGPAPFTTLRVGITTANGISFATGIPLIGINGLEALSNAYPEYTVILNAFCDDLYIGKKGEVACQNIESFLEAQAACLKQPVTYIGNGVPLHYEKIVATLGNKVHLLTDYPYEADLELIAQTAYTRWLKKESITQQIVPTYLKQYSASMTKK